MAGKGGKIIRTRALCPLASYVGIVEYAPQHTTYNI